MAETFTPDNLFGGSTFPKKTGTIIVLTGQNLKRGAVLGRVTASEKMKLADKAAVDGSQEVYCVLAEDVDATSSDKVAVGFLTGEFNENALTFAPGTTAADLKVSARTSSIFFETVVKA